MLRDSNGGFGLLIAYLIPGRSYRLQNRQEAKEAKAPIGNRKETKNSKRAKAPIGSEVETTKGDGTVVNS